jgi:hypothetical protein
MSEELADECNALKAATRELTKARHAHWHRDNMAALNDAFLPDQFRIANNGESVLFRERRKPKVDFYPSTGRWRVAGYNQTFSGGAQEFAAWYAKH